MTSDNTVNSSGASLPATLELMRPANTAIAFVGVVAAGFITNGLREHLPSIMLAAVAATVLSASGNIINDIYDTAIDRINKPMRPLASGRTSLRSAWVLYAICTAAGLLASSLLVLPALLIAVACTLLMWLYSAWLKRIPLIGNVSVGLITGAAFLFGTVVAGSAVAGLVPAVFAFLFNLAREILKDIEDMEGDRACGVRTYPLTHGERNARVMASIVLVLTLAATAVPWMLGMYNKWYLLIVLSGVDTVLVFTIVQIWLNPSRTNIARLCVLMKIDMPIGIAAIAAGSIKGF